jgi:hypothetical protein
VQWRPDTPIVVIQSDKSRITFRSPTEEIGDDYRFSDYAPLSRHVPGKEQGGGGGGITSPLALALTGGEWEDAPNRGPESDDLMMIPQLLGETHNARFPLCTGSSDEGQFDLRPSLGSSSSYEYQRYPYLEYDEASVADALTCANDGPHDRLSSYSYPLLAGEGGREEAETETQTEQRNGGVRTRSRGDELRGAFPSLLSLKGNAIQSQSRDEADRFSSISSVEVKGSDGDVRNSQRWSLRNITLATPDLSSSFNNSNNMIHEEEEEEKLLGG